jgi:hypothetical protein
MRAREAKRLALRTAAMVLRGDGEREYGRARGSLSLADLPRFDAAWCEVIAELELRGARPIDKRGRQ